MIAHHTKLKYTNNTMSNICEAYKSDNLQCTRNKKKGEIYCGTHMKNAPNGSINDIIHNRSPTDSIKPPHQLHAKADNCNEKSRYVYEHNINNIIYFIDDDNNIYLTEDVMLQNINPQIIGKYINEKIILNDSSIC